MERPTSVTVLGILNIVFAIFGIIGSIIAVPMFFLMKKPDAATLAQQPGLKIMYENPGFLFWTQATLVLGVIMTIVLGVAGIGLLNMRPWGRTLSLAYGIFAIVFALLGLVVNFIFLVQPLLAQADRLGPQGRIAAIVGSVASIMGGVGGMIYPLLLVYFLTRPTIAAAFRPLEQDPYSV